MDFGSHTGWLGGWALPGQTTRRAWVACLALAVTLLALPAVVCASSYEGYARTGWNYDNKSYCCEDAVIAAQDNSARACERTGGYADFRRSSARGRCDWETARGGSGGRVYRCSAKASVHCR